MKQEIKRLPDAELEVMKALWQADAPLTRAGLEEALAANGWAGTTLLSRLEGKGYVTREREGRGYRYRAVLTRQEYLPVESRSALGRMFAGSARNLVAAMAETNALSEKDIDELADYLARLKQQHGG